MHDEMNYIIPLGAVALILLAFTRRNKQEREQDATANSEGPPSAAFIQATLKSIAQRFGIDVARNVERIYRLETRNFSSGQFARTNTAGMAAVPGNDAWPWGWSKRGTTPDMFNPLVEMRENDPQTGQPTGALMRFIAFKRFTDAADYLARFLVDYGNNAGRWKSTQAAKQASYVDALSRIPTPFTDAVV